MAGIIRVGAPRISRVSDRVRWSVPLKGDGDLPDTLWYEVRDEFAEMLSDRSDAALLVMMIPALRAGAKIVADGPVTDELAYRFPDAQSLFAEAGLGSRVEPEFTNTRRAQSRGDGVATGFSAGIDSFATIASNFLAANIPASQRLTHLFFNDVGSHGTSDDSPVSVRLRRIEPVARKLGLPLVEVRSNVAEIDPHGHDFNASHTPRNASVAHLLGNGLRTWLYASAYDYRWIGVNSGAGTSGALDPISLPLFSTSSLALQDSGTRFRRVDKTEIVAEIPEAWMALDVCADLDADDQCSCCWKCHRTMMALDILGVLERFDQRFDLQGWPERKGTYLIEVLLARKDPYMAELVELMSERGYPVPARVRQQARLIKVRRPAARVRGLPLKRGRLLAE